MPNSDNIRIRLTGTGDQRAAFVEEMTLGVAKNNFLRHDSEDHTYIECWHGMWSLSFIAEDNLDAVTRKFPAVKVEICVQTDWTNLHVEIAWQGGQCKFFRGDLQGELEDSGVAGSRRRIPLRLARREDGRTGRRTKMNSTNQQCFI